MPARRSPFAIGLSTSLSALVLLISVIGVPQARAAIFDDDEARRQIKDLSIKTNERNRDSDSAAAASSNATSRAPATKLRCPRARRSQWGRDDRTDEEVVALMGLLTAFCEAPGA